MDGGRVTTATLSFRSAGQVQLCCADPAIDETLPLDGALPFAGWAEQYAAAQYLVSEESRLIELGRAIGAWLDGHHGWLARLVQTTAPVILEIETSRQPGPVEQAALDAPWELIAGADTGHLALDPQIRMSVVRRLQVGSASRPPSRCRLSVLFMAAQPRGVTTLDFEQAEVAIASAVKQLGMDLFVEESGTLDGLVSAAQRAATCEVADLAGPAGSVDVLHVTCHGSGGDIPVLLFENEVGDRDEITVARLASQIVNPSKLAIIATSSDSNGAGPQRRDAFAAALCKLGWPAVLSCSADADDTDAMWLVAQLYTRLAQGSALIDALAWCRCDAVAAGKAPRRAWHQARLFLGVQGGGQIAEGTAARRDTRADPRAFVVPDHLQAARSDEFVGRRRALQRVLASLRSDMLPGAVLHGSGQLGKFSLAARVGLRRPDLTTVVVHDAFDADTIFAEIGKRVPAASQLIAQQRPAGAWDADSFGRTLRAVLEGPCSGDRAILLVLDSFERSLDPPRPSDTRSQVVPERATTARALIEAFVGALLHTRSRILFASRYRFTLPDAQNVDLARQLWHEPMAAMPRDELAKCVRAQALRGPVHPSLTTDVREAYQAAAIELCRGNPGLLRLLLASVIEASPDRWPAVESELRAYADRGAPVTQPGLAEFMARVAITALIDGLDPRDRDLLHLLAAFTTYVPVAVAATLAAQVGPAAAGAEAIERLVTMGLVDLAIPVASWPGADAPAQPGSHEVAVNPLAVPLVMAKPGSVVGDTVAQVAKVCVRSLRTAWDAAVRARSLRECGELGRLAWAAGDDSTLAEVAGALAYAVARFDARQAAWFAVAVESNPALWPRADELRVMAEACLLSGKLDVADRLLTRGLALDNLTPRERASLQLARAAWSEQSGDLAQAQQLLAQARDEFERLGDVRSAAVALGRIADILQTRSDFEAALRLLRDQQLVMFEQLGASLEVARTLGQIADIHVARGQLDVALSVLTEKALPIVERFRDPGVETTVLEKLASVHQASGELAQTFALLHDKVLPGFVQIGDTRSAVATQARIAEVMARRGDVTGALRLLEEEVLPASVQLGDVNLQAMTQVSIAGILLNRDQLDEALRRLTELALPIFQRLGAARSIAATLIKRATILAMLGQADEALRILQADVLPVFEQMGDIKSTAVAQLQLANILSMRNELDEALRLLQHEALPVLERIGDTRSTAITRRMIAEILVKRGQHDEALQLLVDSVLPVLEQIGDLREKAIARGVVATIQAARGQRAEALQILTSEVLPVYEQVGDTREAAKAAAKIASLQQ